MQNQTTISLIMEELKSVGLASAYSDEVKEYVSLEKFTLLEDYEPQSKNTAARGNECD